MSRGESLDFHYTMRSVYTHLPINIITQENASVIQIRNFLGKKYILRVWLRSGIACSVSEAEKNELILEGNVIELESKSAALIHQDTTVKDTRKFWDSICF